MRGVCSGSELHSMLIRIVLFFWTRVFLVQTYKRESVLFIGTQFSNLYTAVGNDPEPPGLVSV